MSDLPNDSSIAETLIYLADMREEKLALDEDATGDVMRAAAGEIQQLRAIVNEIGHTVMLYQQKTGHTLAQFLDGKTPKSSVAPAGHRIVPIAPTIDQIMAAKSVVTGDKSGFEITSIYTTMVATAPAQEPSNG